MTTPLAQAPLTAALAPPWIFGVTAIPYGIVGAFCGTTMPFIASQAGISMEDIGWFGTATMVPPMLQFLYSPLVDIGPKRRVWLVLVSVIGAACLCAALTMKLPTQIKPFLILTVLGQLISGLVGSCNGGLMSATVPDALRGKAAGWLNAGNLGGGALGAWVALSMQGKFEPLTVGLSLATLMVLPSLAALWIPEPDREQKPAGEIFGDMLHDVWGVLRSRQGMTGILFCISPVGTAALINYFSGLAKDYQASAGMVAFVNGPVNGLVTAGGSMLGGWVCDRVNRRNAYLVSGGLTAVVGLAMAAAPLTANTYAVGVSVYLFVSGLCYVAFTAVVLEAIGTTSGRGAATQYTLFTAAGNCAIGYTGWLDTRFHTRFGPRGLLGVDAAANLVGIAVLLVLFRALGRPTGGAAAERSV